MVVRISLREIRAQRPCFRLRLPQRRSLLEAAERTEPAGAASGGVRRFLGQRGPQIVFVAECEIRRHDANDFVGNPVQGDAAADRARVAPEITLPETVAEDHDHLTAGVIFVGNEDAAARGPHAERIEKILSDTRAGEAVPLADPRHVPRSREKSGELFERPDLAPNLQEIAAFFPGSWNVT